MTLTVSTHSRPKAAGRMRVALPFTSAGFNTQPPEGGWATATRKTSTLTVSTHSRPKAAGNLPMFPIYWIIGFNTQPPEGGWKTANFGSV